MLQFVVICVLLFNVLEASHLANTTSDAESISVTTTSKPTNTLNTNSDKAETNIAGNTGNGENKVKIEHPTETGHSENKVIGDSHLTETTQTGQAKVEQHGDSKVKIDHPTETGHSENRVIDDSHVTKTTGTGPDMVEQHRTETRHDAGKSTNAHVETGIVENKHEANAEVASATEEKTNSETKEHITGSTNHAEHTDTTDEQSAPATVPVKSNSVAENTEVKHAATTDTAEQQRIDATTTPPTVETTTTAKDDIDPLNIFVSDIKFQRFPQPMAMDVFREQVLGRYYKKLYILEETNVKRVFGMVRQVETVYTMKNDTLYVDFLFRYIYSRKCTEINDYRLGYKSRNNGRATFMKKRKDDEYERILFFSDYPSDYVFLMSCIDLKTSPYACRDRFYLTLESSRDPPNHFKWLEAAQELKAKMNLTFDDPRFMFNFVMTPCVWKGQT